jgi:class 3 adenylate cyclase
VPTATVVVDLRIMTISFPRAHGFPARSLDATARHGGAVVQTEGDGSMLAFPSARRAVVRAHTIQREISTAFSDPSPPIRVRIGLHTGDALNEADGFFGKTIHYAARVAGQALGGEVLVSSVVHDLVSGSGIAFEESREVELKGLEGQHRLYSLDLNLTSDADTSTLS